MKYLLFSIAALAFLLRVVFLDTYPVSVSWDEAAIGYNAYSILKTGKDEYGHQFPVLFQSFNDYKLPGYVYSVALSEMVFGLGPFAVRFPSAVYGTLTVFAFFFLVRELVKSIEKPEKAHYSAYVPYLAAFMLAISPWHIQFSRGGYEANGQLFFLTLGFYFLLKAIQVPRYYYGAALVLGISFYFYYTTRILTPLLGILFLVLFYKEVCSSLRTVLISALVFIVVLLPLIPHLIGDSNTRVTTVSIFNDNNPQYPYTQELARNPDSIISKLLYNRRYGIVHQFLENYARNNSFEYLFVNGDLYPRHDIFGIGMLYVWEWPFVLLGLFVLVKLKSRIKWFFVGWLVFGAIPASLTTGAPHALRTLSTLPAFLLLTALGLWQLLEWLHKKPLWRWVGSAVVVFIACVFLVQYLFFYYDVSMRKYATDWGDGHKQLVQYISSVEDNYDEIHVSGTFFKPYIYFLFYKKYDPARYQAEMESDKKFSKYIFYPADWEDSGKSLEGRQAAAFYSPKKILFAVPYGSAITHAKFITEITSTFNKKVFTIYSL